jgi:DNA primase
VSLPDGEDPDSFVRQQGRAAMETQLGQAIDLFDRQVQLLERRGWFADLRQRRNAIDKLLPTIRAARAPLTRDLYLARLSAVTQLDKATLAAEADALPDRERRNTTAGEARAHPGAVVRSDDGDGPPPFDGPPPEFADSGHLARSAASAAGRRKAGLEGAAWQAARTGVAGHRRAATSES